MKRMARKMLLRYGEKCEQHLKRVRLSHLLAMEAVEAGPVSTDPRLACLMDEAFDRPQEHDPGKLRNAFRELHLSALKAEHELHVKLICKALDVSTECKKGKDLKNLIAAHTGVNVDSVLSPQVRVAFALRNLIEHHDCRVDAGFAKQYGKHWPQSSWGRESIPAVGVKVPIAEEDLEATYNSLLTVGRDLTDKLLAVRRGGGPLRTPRARSTSKNPHDRAGADPARPRVRVASGSPRREAA